jgi:hypothetical protein
MSEKMSERRSFDNHTDKTLGLHKNLGLHASAQGLLQKVISAKHLEPGFKNNPRQDFSGG